LILHLMRSVFVVIPRPPGSPLFPYTTLFRSEKGEVRTRLISGREGARLMGLPDDYILPKAATGALHVVGDGVAVPVVRFMTERRSEEHTSELQSRENLVCRLLLEKKKKKEQN